MRLEMRLMFRLTPLLIYQVRVPAGLFTVILLVRHQRQQPLFPAEVRAHRFTIEKQLRGQLH